MTTAQTVAALQGRDCELREPEPFVMDDMLALCSTNRHYLCLLSLFAIVISEKKVQKKGSQGLCLKDMLETQDTI